MSNICTITFEIHKIICIDALPIGKWYIVQIKAQLIWVIEKCAQLHMCTLFTPPAKKRTVKCLANSPLPSIMHTTGTTMLVTQY